MKKYLRLVALLAYVTVGAQDFQGVAVYESKTSMDLEMSETKPDGKELPLEIEAELQEQLKKAFEKTYTLRFDKVASVYKEEEKLDKPSNGNLTVSVNFSMGGLQYRNLKEKKTITEADLFGKDFLITDSLHKMDWKLGSETKTIGNYTCFKATATLKAKIITDKDKAIALTDIPDKDITITAWYTPDIPVSHGPANYWGLPGLILEVNDGRTSLLCSKITLNPKEKLEIKAPKKGEKISKEEYDKVVEKKTKEMMEMNEGPAAPGTTKRVIRIGG